MKLGDLKKIGSKTLERLNANNIYTPEDLMLFFPKKYTIYEPSIEHLFSGDYVCFRCVVDSKVACIKYRRNVNAIVFYAIIKGYRLKCIIFSGDYLRFKLFKGLEIICFGRYKKENKEFNLKNVFFEDFDIKIDIDYAIKDVNNQAIACAIESAINAGIKIKDDLPGELVEKYRLLSMMELIKTAHFPTSKQDCIEVRRRRRYEDFFWYTASLESLKLIRDAEIKSPKFYSLDTIQNYLDFLPYELTADQKDALNVILSELSSSKIMNRLIQGDVGCGKSIVAFLACIANVSAGFQSAIMAPTEILAVQHYENLSKLVKGKDIQIALLTSSTKNKEKEEILYKLIHKRIDIIVGTHSLIQDPVIFSKLGMVVIDEQHRFGVAQRKKLIEKYSGVDALYLTATPIPRTLGLTVFGDLDLTSIKSMPKNRKSIVTKLISMDEIDLLGETLKKHIMLNEQIYIVVPLIEESESLDFIDMDQAVKLFEGFLPNAKIKALHGKMKSLEKKEIMNEFKNHQLDCLISTTVIEVGVDVKNATVMVILDADRYGISQIHQLRGRVGRGDLQSYCYLVSKRENVERLEILAKTNDGFYLAEEDLRLRGPGNFLGDEQSGFMALGFDEGSNDFAIWRCAANDSKEFIAKYFNGEFENSKIESIIQDTMLKKAKIN